MTTDQSHLTCGELASIFHEGRVRGLSAPVASRLV